MHVKVEKHPTENKARVIVTGEPGDEASIDLLFQALLTTAKREGRYLPGEKNAFVVLVETTPVWKNP